MDWLSIIGNVASVIGLAVSVYTLYKVQSLPRALRQHSRNQQLTELIDKIGRLKGAKSTIEGSTALEIDFIIKTARLYYVTRGSSRSRELAGLLESLEAELAGARRREVVQNHLRLIRDEILIR